MLIYSFFNILGFFLRYSVLLICYLYCSKINNKKVIINAIKSVLQMGT